MFKIILLPVLFVITNTATYADERQEIFTSHEDFRNRLTQGDNPSYDLKTMFDTFPSKIMNQNEKRNLKCVDARFEGQKSHCYISIVDKAIAEIETAIYIERTKGSYEFQSGIVKKDHYGAGSIKLLRPKVTGWSPNTRDLLVLTFRSIWGTGIGGIDSVIFAVFDGKPKEVLNIHQNGYTKRREELDCSFQSKIYIPKRVSFEKDHYNNVMMNEDSLPWFLAVSGVSNLKFETSHPKNKKIAWKQIYEWHSEERAYRSRPVSATEQKILYCNIFNPENTLEE